MADDLHVICEELRRIGLHPVTPAAREKLEGALSSKWDGVQVAAAKALSQWGDALSLHALRDLLAAVASNPHRRSAVWAVARALRPHLQPSDLDWVIDLFIHRTRPGNRFYLGVLFEAFAPNEVRNRLEARLGDARGAKADLRTAIARAEWRSKAESTVTQGGKPAKESQNAKRKTQVSKLDVRRRGAARIDQKAKGKAGRR